MTMAGHNVDHLNLVASETSLIPSSNTPDMELVLELPSPHVPYPHLDDGPGPVGDLAAQGVVSCSAGVCDPRLVGMRSPVDVGGRRRICCGLAACLRANSGVDGRIGHFWLVMTRMIKLVF